MHAPERLVVQPEALDALIEALRRRGYRVLGPTVRDGAIVYDELESADELPIGWTDRQDGGHVPPRAARRRGALRLRGRAALVEAVPLPAARPALAGAADGDGGIEVEEEPRRRARRSPSSASARCELHAIEIQDRVFLGGRYVDRDYAARREDAFVVAVNCFEPGGTCFCVSMGTGPKAEAGYDLALTEIARRRAPLPRRGRAASAAPRCSPSCRARPAVDGRPGRRRRASSRRRGSGWAARSTRTTCRDLLARNLEHPRWDDVAERCLTCGNCTLVCPTCFCSTRRGRDRPRRASTAERWRRLGLVLLASTTPTSTAAASGRRGRSRYRQWLTHKLGTWHDQFGTSGCVGCGRCITWCPVGIDITEEVAAIRATGGGRAMRTLDRSSRDAAVLRRARRRRRLELLAGCALERPLRRRARRSSARASAADAFYLVRHGSVALETLRCRRAARSRSRRSRPARSLGWSWLFPPYRWHFDARALTPVRATAFDGACLRGKCDDDPALGYELMKRFAQVLIERLQWTRLRLLDVYGDGRR